jgi:hypothetical protein
MKMVYKVWMNQRFDEEIIEMDYECYGSACEEQAMRLYCNLNGLEYILHKDELHCVQLNQENADCFNGFDHNRYSM